MKQAMKNAMLAGSSSFSFKQKIPKQYNSRQKQYMNYETRMFTEQTAQYSSDYVEAQIQGLNPEEPFGYTTVHIRFSDIVRSSSAISYEFDNYKVIDIAESEYSYVRIGAKVQAMGSTWLVINPANMGNVLGKAMIQRCDAVWHFLDYYGNVLSEPLCFDRRLAKANDSDAQRSTMITKGYFDCYVQYNENTKQLDTNSRLILGTAAYHVTGYSDFIQEFTDDYNSVNMLGFDVRYEEPNYAIDDMENHVAGGKTFKWDIQIAGTPTLMAGESTQLTATSIRTAEEKTEVVESTSEHPIYYIWESSDESIAVVDAYGAVTAVSEGVAEITCTLAQNNAQKGVFSVTVAGSATDPHVSFLSTAPESIGIYKEATLTAAYFENGQQTEEKIEYTFTGARTKAYTTNIRNNTVTIKCWGGSVEPLTITATHGEYSTTEQIYLEGI